MRVALLGASNLDVLGRYLSEELAERGLDGRVHLSAYGQHEQAVLGDDPALRAFSPDHIVLALDLDDLLMDVIRNPMLFDPAGRRARVDEELTRIERLASILEARFPQATVVFFSATAPALTSLGALEWNSDRSVRDVATLYNVGLRDLAGRGQRRLIFDYESLVLRFGHDNWYDDRMWYVARIRWGPRAMRELARALSAFLRAVAIAPRKCIVLDLDGTLWGGVVGEDGMGVELAVDGPGLAYRDFQHELLNMHRRGILLAVSSKNNPDDAWEVIDHHPAMILRREHFSAVKIGWTDKATSVREVADELDIGLSAMIFIDDDAAECEWVRSQCPEVEVVALSREPADFKRTLLMLDSLLAVSMSAEDLARPRLYRQRAQAEELRRESVSIEEFYNSLQMDVEIRRASVATIPRIAQLTRKTNQFNLTSRRYSDAEMSQLSNSDAHEVYSLALRDRFGDHGIVGVGIIAQRGDSFWIDTLLLSCRVLGRTLERAFISFLASRARIRGARALVGEFVPTKKNMPARDVYRDVGMRPLDSDGRLWRLEMEGRELTVPPYVRLRVMDAREGALA